MGKLFKNIWNYNLKIKIRGSNKKKLQKIKDIIEQRKSKLKQKNEKLKKTKTKTKQEK